MRWDVGQYAVRSTEVRHLGGMEAVPNDFIENLVSRAVIDAE